MFEVRCRIAAFALACASTVALAQAGNADSLEVGRQMLAEDNPGELWIDQGKELFYQAVDDPFDATVELWRHWQFRVRREKDPQAGNFILVGNQAHSID